MNQTLALLMCKTLNFTRDSYDKVVSHAILISLEI